MGDSQNDTARVEFDRKIKLEFHGSTVTSDAGLLAYRELDDALGLTSTAASGLHDARTGQNTQHSLLALLRQSIYSRLAGYEDVNDAERLCLDPALRAVVGGRAKDNQTASTSEMARFETETLSTKENLKYLMDLSGQWIDQAHQHRKLTKLILDMNSSVSETYGHQEGTAYNGHFGCTCYHPLFLFNQFGDLERVMLRRGNRGSAKYWRRVLLPVIARYRGLDIPKFFRGDAAFAGPKLLRLLEREGFRYAIRIKSNAVLERKIAPLLKRPVGRPSRKPKVFYHSFRYRAGSWECARRVVAKVEWHAGELFPRVGFIVTNLKWRSKKVVRFYNRRGTADEVLKEVKRLRCGQAPSAGEGADRRADGSQSLAQCLLSGQFASPDPFGQEGEGSVSSPVPSEGGRSREPDGAGVARAASDSASGAELTSQTEAQYFRIVAQMGVQVAAGLDYAHKQGILHRDIKPSNLLLDARGTVWITDFGLAKSEGSDELTHTGDLVGTLRYMAPERFGGWSDPRSDVYGLGITLYELLALRPAFEDSYRPQMIARVTHDDPPRPRKVDPSIPRDLETIVLKAIEKEPGRRYQTAADLASDLGRFVAGEPVRARRITLWERGVKWVKRRPAVAALLAFSAAAVVSLVVGSLLYSARLGTALRDAQDNLDKARRAENQARVAGREQTRQLALALVSDAQARRNSGLMGRRFDSLEALTEAARHFRALGQLDEKLTLTLRNEAIACLPLADLKAGRERTPSPEPWNIYAIDPASRYYVVRLAPGTNSEKGEVREGQLSVRRVADDEEVVSLPGFGARVDTATFSPDGRYLAVHYAGGEHHNCVWDLDRREATLRIAQGRFAAEASFSPDSRLVALGRPDRSIRIYEMPSGATWKDLPPGLLPSQVHFQPEGGRLAVVSENVVQLRDLDGGAAVATFEHPSDVACLAWRGDGKVFATGCYDSDIYLWDPANSSRPPRILQGHYGAVVHLSFNHGGELLLSNSWDSTDRLWDPSTEREVVNRPGGLFRDFHFAADDRALDDGWQVATGRECRTFHGRKMPHRVAICPRGPLGGRLMAVMSSDGVQLWDLAATREGDKFLGTVSVVGSLAVAFDPAGDGLFTDDRAAGFQRWPIALDPRTGAVRVGPPHSPGLCAQAPRLWPPYEPEFDISADGRRVAYSARPGHALLFDWADPGRKLLIESSCMRDAVFSPDGRWLAAGNWHGKGARVWDARTGKEEHPFDLHESLEGTAWPAFSPDGQWLVIGTAEEYSFWEVGSWQMRFSLPRENAGKSRGWIVFAPDSKVVALLHSVSEVRLVDPVTGHEFARLPSGGTPYCFSPDGSQLVTYAGRAGGMHVWDLRLIRRQLKDMDLDWDLPSYPQPPSENAQPLRLTVLDGERPPASDELCARAHVERGLLYLGLRKHSAAWADFFRAGELDPGRPPWEEVVFACSRELERNPDDADVYHLRARAHERLSRQEKALDDFGQAIKRCPSRPDFLGHRGLTYLLTGRKDRAAEDFRKAGEASAGHANWLAWTLATSPNEQYRDPGLAVELAKQALRQAPGEASYWNTLGVAHYRLGEWEAAVRALEESERLETGKRFSVNGFFLAMCHHRLGDPVKARDYYDRAVRWYQANEAELHAEHRQELKAFQAEAKGRLKVAPGP